MNVVYSVKNYHPAHAGIVSALQSDGHSVLLLYRDEKESETKNGANYAAVDSLQVPASRVSSRAKRLSKSTSIWISGWLIRTFRQFRPDVVITYHFSQSQRLIGAIGYLFGAKVICLADKPEVARSWLGGARLALKYSVSPRRRIHCGAYGQVGRPFSLGPCHGRSWLSPYPVDPEQGLRLRLPSLPGRVRILCMGSANTERSRMEYVLEAVAYAGIQDQVEITFFQRPWKAESLLLKVRRLEEEMGLPPSTVRSDVTDERLRPAFSEFDLMVYPSRNNPYGQTIGEALAHGLPVLCCDSVGASILIEDGVNGSVFQTDSLKDFAHKLEALVSDRHALERMSKEATRRSRATHSSEAWLRTFYAVLNTRSLRSSRVEPES